MKHLFSILLLIGMISCQVLDKREIPLSNSFCKSCKKPLKELMLKTEGIYVVKYQKENKLFYNYDADLIDVDSLENELMRKGYLPRKDSIILHPVCCNLKPKKVEVIDGLK